MNAVDPITVEVIRNYLYSTTGEMRRTLMRAAYNPIIYEIKDFALGLYDRQIRLIAQDMGIPLFLGSLGQPSSILPTVWPKAIPASCLGLGKNRLCSTSMMR